MSGIISTVVKDKVYESLEATTNFLAPVYRVLPTKNVQGSLIFYAPTDDIYYNTGEEWRLLAGGNGNQGAQGNAGNQGSSGVGGYQGAQGFQSSNQGYQGTQGLQGAGGAQGLVGYTGFPGATGSAGTSTVIQFCAFTLTGGGPNTYTLGTPNVISGPLGGSLIPNIFFRAARNGVLSNLYGTVQNNSVPGGAVGPFSYTVWTAPSKPNPSQPPTAGPVWSASPLTVAFTLDMPNSGNFASAHNDVNTVVISAGDYFAMVSNQNLSAVPGGSFGACMRVSVSFTAS